MPALCIEQSYHDPPTVTCVSAAPILKRMKVLKKFKRRMGLAPSRSDTVQHPPLLFHQVCGDNVRIDSNGKVARRVESFCKGIAFSARPVKVGEKVCVRLLEISTNWSGVIRFGFTSQDPVGLRDALPKYACPDLTSKPGYWAKALSERFADQGLVLNYYYTSTGDVHFGINGEDKGLFFSGVETRGHLWAVIDVYGNSTAVEFLDPSSQLNNRTHIVNDLRPGTTTAQSRVLPQSSSPTQVSNRAIQNRPLPTPATSSPPPPQLSSQQSQSEIERVQSTMAQLTLSRGSRHYPYIMTPLPFGNKVIGRNVVFNYDRTLASRQQGEYSHGYVFTQRPLLPGEQIIIQVVETEPLFVGAMAFGLTAANPAGLEPADLPDDCDLLLDRPEYWVVSKDVASSPACGDELAFGLTTYGAVTYSRNGSSPQTIMHVDHSLQLWAFFDVYGNTKMIKMLGVMPITNPQVTRRSVTPDSTPAPTSTPSPQSRPIVQAPLVVKLPPSPPALAPSGDNRHNQMRSEGGNTITSVGSSIYIEPLSRTTTMSLYGGGQGPYQGQQGIPHECTVCYEKAVDSVLYICGHMCMCYECALQQWRGRGGGQCPICRAPIKDVIRTYRS